MDGEKGRDKGDKKWETARVDIAKKYVMYIWKCHKEACCGITRDGQGGDGDREDRRKPCWAL